MPQQQETAVTQQIGLIRSLVIGTVLLLTGLALGLKLRAPEPEITRIVETSTQVPDQDQHPEHVEKKPASITVGNEFFSSHDDRDAEVMDETTHTSSADNNLPGEPDPAIIARRQEMQYLQEVLPDNNMIPHDKSPQQLDAMWDEFNRYHELQQHIDAGDATDAEKDEYYAIRMAKYEEERALIELCRDVAANTLADSDENKALLCQHMTESSAERLQVIEDSIAKLEQDLWVSSQRN